MVNSKRKGKRGELEARNEVRNYWFAPDCRRTAQVDGSLSADLAQALPGAHLEVKRPARLGVLKYIQQAEADAGEGEIPVVLTRPDGYTDWLVMFRIKDTNAFVRGYLINRGKQWDDR